MNALMNKINEFFNYDNITIQGIRVALQVHKSLKNKRNILRSVMVLRNHDNMKAIIMNSKDERSFRGSMSIHIHKLKNTAPWKRKGCQLELVPLSHIDIMGQTPKTTQRKLEEVKAQLREQGFTVETEEFKISFGLY